MQPQEAGSRLRSLPVYALPTSHFHMTSACNLNQVCLGRTRFLHLPTDEEWSSFRGQTPS